MKRVIKNIFVFAALVLLEGCVHEGAPISALGTPKFVPQSQPDSVVESGIGQDPNTGGMFLQWYSVPAAAGYKLYRTDTTGVDSIPMKFHLVGEVASSTSLSDTSTVDVNSIHTGIRYYYYLRAYAADGSLSPESDTTNYMLLARPTPDYVSAAGSNFVFVWGDRAGGGYTVLRVVDMSLFPHEYIWITPRFHIYGGSSSVVKFDFDSTATAPLLKGHTYQWRVDRFYVDSVDRPDAGSRSAWATFSIN